MAPGTPSAWATPPAAPTRRRLTITGDFCVDGGHHHQLDQQARRLGFADLRSCLHALLDDGWSIPQLAAHLRTTQAAIRAAIADHHIQQPSRRELLARQRRRAAADAARGPKQQARAVQRRQARVAELGFAGLEEYLRDRFVGRSWSVRRLGAELGAGHGWVDKQLRQLGLRD